MRGLAELAVTEPVGHDGVAVRQALQSGHELEMDAGQFIGFDLPYRLAFLVHLDDVLGAGNVFSAAARVRFAVVSERSAYSFGDSELAAERLALLAGPLVPALGHAVDAGLKITAYHKIGILDPIRFGHGISGGNPAGLAIVKRIEHILHIKVRDFTYRIGPAFRLENYPGLGCG